MFCSSEVRPAGRCNQRITRYETPCSAIVAQLFDGRKRGGIRPDAEDPAAQADTEPLFAALVAGEFQIVSGEGDVCSVGEIGALLHVSGWRLVEQPPPAGAASLLIAEAS